MSDAVEHVPLARVSLTELSGVGAVRAAAFARLGLHSVRDLLLFLPREHEASGVWCQASEVGAHVGAMVRVRGVVNKIQSFRRGPRRSTLRFVLKDESGEIAVNVFNQPWRIPAAREWAARAEEIAVEARVAESQGQFVLSSPRFEDASKPWEPEGTTRAIYATTEGLGAEWLTRIIQAAVATYASRLVERLPDFFRKKHGLPSLKTAVRALHAGQDGQENRRRVALESLAGLQARLVPRPGAGAEAPCVTSQLQAVRAVSPYEWTPGQEHAITTILDDLATPRPMRRLLQGDVGSGKTLVAACVADAVIAGGGQVALMAPTATLAEQHFAGLGPWFEQRGVRVDLITGGCKAAERRRAQERLASGETNLAIGTHALVSSGVRFKNLVLGIVDEEQRFGVAQRSSLIAHGEHAHALVMTATPIPRSLALTLYGEWDSVKLEGFPPGRGLRRTRVVDPKELPRVERYAEERLEAGEQVFWIVPRISGEEDSIEAVEAHLQALPLARFGLEVVHGRLEAAERQARLRRFSEGISRVLLATTVIEVGVDVPAATVMVVQGAERFGLAQLHQLRGRVGRGRKPSIAAFMTKRSSRQRCSALEQTEDGFEIAEADLVQRGMGELLGRRQSGVSVSALEEVIEDVPLIEATRALLRARADLTEFYLDPGNCILG